MSWIGTEEDREVNLTAAQKSAEGVVGHASAKLLRHSTPKGGATDRRAGNDGRRPERVERQVGAATHGAKSGRKTSSDWPSGTEVG